MRKDQLCRELRKIFQAKIGEYEQMLGGQKELDMFEEQKGHHCGSRGRFLVFEMGDAVGCLCADGN